MDETMINPSAIDSIIPWLRLIGWYCRYPSVSKSYLHSSWVFPNKNLLNMFHHLTLGKLTPEIKGPGYAELARAPMVLNWMEPSPSHSASTFDKIFSCCVFLDLWIFFEVFYTWDTGEQESQVDCNIQLQPVFWDSEAFLHSLHAHLSWDQYQCDLVYWRCDICDLWFIYGAFKHGDFYPSLFGRFTILTYFKGLETTSYDLDVVVLVMTQRP